MNRALGVMVLGIGLGATSLLGQNNIPPGGGMLPKPEVSGRERDRFEPDAGIEDRPRQVAPDIAWNQADLVVVAVISDVQNGPVAQSMPPIWSNKLTIEVDKVLRGDMEDKKFVVNHSYRNEVNYNHRVGEKYVLALSNSRRNGWTVVRIVEADEAALKEAETACSLPVGWTLEDGKVKSPWSGKGKDVWSATVTPAPDAKAVVCSVTNRPALMVGPKATLTVEMVPPAKEVQWSNPDGDGEYTITVTNATDADLTVPALLTQNGKILWKESLAIVCQKKSYAVPGSSPVTGKVEATTLKPGQSVSTTINALTLQGPSWPRGGYRIEFTFALGEKSVTSSFYYMSRHHDPIRSKSLKEMGIDPSKEAGKKKDDEDVKELPQDQPRDMTLPPPIRSSLGKQPM